MNAYLPAGARRHQFRGGEAVVYADKTCRFFPIWCPCISTPVTRAQLARALRERRAGR